MEVIEENWRKTENQLQQFIAATQQAFQDAAKQRAESDLRIAALTELVKKFIKRCEQSPFVANHNDSADAGRETETPKSIEGSPENTNREVKVLSNSAMGESENGLLGEQEKELAQEEQITNSSREIDLNLYFVEALTDLQI